MSLKEAIAFLVFAVVAAITPGPGNLILTSTAAAVGLIRGLRALLGQAIGMGVMLSVTGVGLASLLLRSGLALQLLKWCGIGLLLWLAFQLARAGPHDAQAGGVHFGFWQAAAFQWVNPKAWLVCAAAIGAFMPAGGGNVLLRAGLLGLLMTTAALPSCFVWLAAGGTMRRLLKSERASRAFNLTMAALLAGSILLLIR